MKKFSDIVAEIKTADAQIRALENLRAEQGRKFTEYADYITLTASRKIMINNARIALYNEVLPVVLTVLDKYKGRPYGEKTRQKISDAVKSATGARFYIGRRYDLDTCNVYPDCGFGVSLDISFGPKYHGGDQARLLKDNKIQTVPAADFELYYISSEYVDDIPGRIALLQDLHKKAVEKQAELDAICSAYNKMAGDITHIYSDKHIPANFTA